ncbi:MAG: adenylate/guanylate cyclase domain-containing protein, partial [Spirochaetota bacterium]
RHYRLVSYHLDQAVPTLGLAPLLVAGDTGLDIEFRNGVAYAGGKTIPVDRDGRVLLRYTTPERIDPETGETIAAYHTSFPAFDVVISGFNLASGGEPTLDPTLFEGKHVLIGPSAAGLLDLRPNPLIPRAPGVTAHATALDNLLANDFLQEFPMWATILLLVALAFGAAYAATRAEKTHTEALIIVGFLAFVPLLAIGGYLLGFWVPIVVPLVALVVALAGANVANYATEGAEKRFIRGAFSQYLSPSVIADIEADPSKLELGGVERELTMFFSDIQGFTTLSEGLEPTQLAGFLQHYLTEFVEIIQSEGGTIDKFEGDAIIAFWNAPLELPDHPIRGVRAALRCQRRLAELRPLYLKATGSVDEATGAPGVGKEIVTRIGLNTARVSVGNFGSRTRMDYTALGDGMNLAARLEGANKVFRSVLMISRATRDRLDEDFRSRELGRLQVVGRVEPVTVFEPMFADDYAADSRRYEIYDEALRLWYNNRLDEARERFASIADSDDPASRMVEQIDAWLAKPPETRKGWSGVVSLTEK